MLLKTVMPAARLTVVAGEPSPQSITTLWAWFASGSLNEPARLRDSPSLRAVALAIRTSRVGDKTVRSSRISKINPTLRARAWGWGRAWDADRSFRELLK